MKQISVNQFKETVIASVEHFANSVKPDTEEEVELQSFENWWEEFKDYMEEM